MTKLDDLQKAIAALPPKDQAKFRTWFAGFEAARAKAAPAAKADDGGLKRLAREAIADFKAGRTRNL